MRRAFKFKIGLRNAIVVGFAHKLSTQVADQIFIYLSTSVQFFFFFFNNQRSYRVVCLFAVGSMIVAGGSVFFVWLMNSRALVLVVTCIFTALTAVTYNVLDIVTVELYPTALRYNSRNHSVHSAAKATFPCSLFLSCRQREKFCFVSWPQSLIK